MNQGRFEASDDRRRTGRHSLRKAGGLLTGAASLLPVTRVANAGEMMGARASFQGQTMPTRKPDRIFYPTPRFAMQVPVETLAYVAQVNPNDDGEPDMLRVVDLHPASPTYGKVLGGVAMPTAGDELHHVGWNACSSTLCPNAAHPHGECRYLIAPGLCSSTVHSIDTRPDPANPMLAKTIDAADIAACPGRHHGQVGCRKVISIAAEPADEDALSPALKRLKAVPQLVSEIKLSVDDQCLYVSCWGTDELIRYDVSGPVNPV
jgi:hypothetical protein